MITMDELNALLIDYAHVKCVECGRRNGYRVNVEEPVRVICRCRCGLTRIYYPLDKEGDDVALRLVLGVTREELVEKSDT